jgi:hypothetical protein
LPPLTVGVCIPSHFGVRNGWNVYGLPPPTDLLSLLQRLVI